MSDAAAPLPRRAPWLAIGLAALAAALLLVTIVGDRIEDGAQFAFDKAVLLTMREPGALGVPEGPAFLKQAMLDVTALGGGTILTLVVALGAGFLLLQRHVLTALLVLAGGITGPAAVSVAKQVFGRQRPEVIDHLVEVGSASFPSGHSANSAAVYLTLALVLVQIVERRAERVYLLAAAALLVLAIGASRVYLGVHWPSDVLAGWAFGALWAVGWWAIGHWLRARYAPEHGLDATPDRSA
ncbi:phosphatase PAP2 family protein [Novosphingopyxis sp.]|uniref:phosphatase PAP2 family protein n=1 Tax=Novosphingopyxis sp. TaxID=2709690 RepID=UPI003B58CB23